MALMAYWGMIETSLNRKRFMAGSSPMGSFLPSSSTVPATWRMRPSSRIRLLPRVDLPQPDSPASPTSSPSATPKLTPSRARTSPRRVRYQTLRSSTRRLTVSQLPQPGVEDLVEADVHDVERPHDHGDPEARRDEPPPHAQRQGAPQDGVVHHQPERDAVGRAEPDEVERGRGQDRPPEQQDEGHEQVRAHVGGDLGEDDADGAGAAEAGQVDELPGAQRERLGPDGPGHPRPGEEPDEDGAGDHA